MVFNCFAKLSSFGELWGPALLSEENFVHELAGDLEEIAALKLWKGN